MLVFCPVCGGFLTVRGGSASNQFACDTCPYKLAVTGTVSSKLYPKLKDLDEVLGGPSAWENAEITEEQCPRCAHTKAYFMQIQTRSADEPATIFYRCANNECTYRWKD
ncbi:DNA-directed RNA polymerase subunit [Aphelenchoides fujianensis]|nr:DNA-directed RNA polymerase subunit [Aphelenchoides fujianensis]